MKKAVKTPRGKVAWLKAYLRADGTAAEIARMESILCRLATHPEALLAREMIALAREAEPEKRKHFLRRASDHTKRVAASLAKKDRADFRHKELDRAIAACRNRGEATAPYVREWMETYSASQATVHRRIKLLQTPPIK